MHIEHSLWVSHVDTDAIILQLTRSEYSFGAGDRKGTGGTGGVSHDLLWPSP